MNLDHFDAGSRADEPRALACDLEGLLQARCRHDHVPAHELFHLYQRPVRHGLSGREPPSTKLAAEIDELSWNFSRHSLNLAYIACIWAGEGFSAGPPPGKLRCKHRYLGMFSLLVT